MGNICNQPVGRDFESDPALYYPRHILFELIEAEARFELLLASPDPSLEGISTDHFKIYCKYKNCSFSLRSEWLSTHPAEKYIRFLSDSKARIAWDSNLERIKEQDSDDNTTISYSLYKSVLGTTPIDLVCRNRLKRHGSGWEYVSTSITHADHPESKDTVRLQLILGGCYAESVQPGATRIVCICECDLGGSIPSVMVKSAASALIPAFAGNLEAALTNRSYVYT